MFQRKHEKCNKVTNRAKQRFVYSYSNYSYSNYKIYRVVFESDEIVNKNNNKKGVAIGRRRHQKGQYGPTALSLGIRRTLSLKL